MLMWAGCCLTQGGARHPHDLLQLAVAEGAAAADHPAPSAAASTPAARRGASPSTNHHSASLVTGY